MLYHSIRKCRICGNNELLPLLDLGRQALTGVFPRSREEEVAVAPLELVKCWGAGCGLVQLRHSVNPELMYGANYGYRSGLNRSMILHLRDHAAAVRRRAALGAGDIVLDIGSNDGTFLNEIAAPGVTLVGMDPTGNKFRRFYPAGAFIVPETFSAARFRNAMGRKKAKVVASIAMFYDLEDPLEFVLQVKEVLAADGIWLLEQSYLPALLESGSYDTICHEHLEYYALRQIAWLAERAGMRILDIETNDTNGGSFAVTMEHAGTRASAGSAVAEMMKRESEFGLEREPVYRAFRERAFRHRKMIHARLDEAKSRRECVVGYGASTKGNVLLQFAGIGPSELPCVAEVNPDKFGCFTPGTGIPIVSEAAARALRPDAFLVLPWHFRANTIAREREFLRRGGRMIFPLPELAEVGAAPLAASA